MSEETWGPFDTYKEVECGTGRNARGTFGVPVGKILSFDDEGRRVFTDAPAPKPEKKTAAKKK